MFYFWLFDLIVNSEKDQRRIKMHENLLSSLEHQVDSWVFEKDMEDK